MARSKPKQPFLYRGQSLARGLVGAWLLWEGAGTRVGDASGCRNHGLMTNMDAGDWVIAEQGAALDFEGVHAEDEYVDLGTDPSLEVQEHTIVCRLLLRDTGFNAFFAKEGVSSDGYEWEIRGGVIAYAYNDGAVRGWYTSYNGSVPLNVWTTVAATWSPARGSVEFFINGEYTSQRATPTNNIVHNSSRVARLGNRELDSSEEFNGQIAGCLLYRRVLTHVEIRRLHVDLFAIFRRRPRIIDINPAVGGPYHVGCGQHWHTGAAAGQTFNTGQTAGQIDG